MRWIEAVQQGWLGFPTVRLTPASILVCKTVIGIIALISNDCIGQLRSIHYLLYACFFCASVLYESFSASVSMSYPFLTGMHSEVVFLQLRLEQRCL